MNNILLVNTFSFLEYLSSFIGATAHPISISGTSSLSVYLGLLISKIGVNFRLYKDT